MKLLIVRHGETEENVRGTITGHKPGKLTERGKAHAEKLATELLEFGIDLIFSSDLRRCKDTTAIIRRQVKAPVKFLKELREISSGVFDGKTMPELRAAMSASGLSRLSFKPKGGESLLEFRKRVGLFLWHLRSDRKLLGKTVLICTHTAWTKELLRLVRKSGKAKEDIITLELKSNG